tara:strand:- start:1012 stop:1377 length:366 start_codon:yes stop_codon:yes gene_type:complete
MDEVLGCTETSACNFNSDATDDNDDCEFPEIGCDCDGFVLLNIGADIQGSILFYIDDTGQHGLIVGKEDLGEFIWACHNTTIPDADNFQIGSGPQQSMKSPLLHTAFILFMKHLVVTTERE